MLKSFRVIGASAVFLLLGWTVSADSRQEQQDRPKNQERQQQKANPARRDQPRANRRQDQQRQQPQRQGKGQQDQQRQQQRQRQDNSAKQQQQARGQQDRQRQQRQQQDNRSAQRQSPAHVRQQRVAWQRERAHSWQSEHRTWQQRGGYNGYRVPDDRFRGYYGQDHGFRIYSLPVMFVGGHRRFRYGGYWFSLVDPWPEYWSDNWYENDDVYIDYYDDGYYLYNRRHPGVRIAISFYLN